MVLPPPARLDHAVGAICHRIFSVPVKWAREKNAWKGTRVPHMYSRCCSEGRAGQALGVRVRHHHDVAWSRHLDELDDAIPHEVADVVPPSVNVSAVSAVGRVLGRQT
eukprot:368217-Rhodomonas_salina.9